MLDHHISDALDRACESLHQGTTLASEIAAWIEAIAVGNETLDDDDVVLRRLDLLYKTVSVRENKESAEA